MATKKDLSKLKHTLVYAPLHFYSEVDGDGTETLRHIRVQQRTFDVPADGVTIDTIPADSVGTEQIKTNAVGSAEIKDGSIIMDDLSPKAREQMENHFATDDDVRTALGLPAGN